MLRFGIVNKSDLMLLLAITSIILSTAIPAPGGMELEVRIPEDPFVVLEQSEDWRSILELEQRLEHKQGVPEKTMGDIRSRIEDIKYKVTALNASGSQCRVLGLGLKDEMLAIDARRTEIDSKYKTLLEQSPPQSQEELQEIQGKYQAELLDVVLSWQRLGQRIAGHNERFEKGPLRDVDLLFENQIKPLLAQMRRVDAQPWWKTKIGVAGGVDGEVFCEDPDGERRPMSSGKLIYHNSKCITGPDGRMQVLLLDETVFTIGPDSEMVMDEFVYDPSTQSGTISASLTKGVLRFVTGKIARKKPESMNIKMPVGTIGIRGTEGIVRVRPDGVASNPHAGQVTILHGEVRIVASDSGDVVTVGAGRQVSIGADGAIEPLKEITPSEADRQWRAETGITWSDPADEDRSWTIRIDGALIRKLGHRVIGFIPWFLFAALIISVKCSFLDLREMCDAEKFFWLVLGVAAYMSIDAARNPDLTYWENIKSTMLASGIVLFIIFLVPTVVLDLTHRMTDMVNSALRRFPGAWFAKVLAVVTFGFGVFLTVSCGSDWIKYIWYFVIKHPSKPPNLGWRAETPVMCFVAAVGSLAALNARWLFLPPRKDYFRKKTRRKATFRHRSTRGLYGALIGCILGAAASLFYPLQSVWTPLVGWIMGELLPLNSDSLRRSWATAFGVIAGTVGMILLIASGPPIMILMVLPAFFALVAYNLERALDKRKAVGLVGMPEPQEQTTWDEAPARPEHVRAVVCPVCGNNVGKRNRVACLACGDIVHLRNCSFEEGADSHICARCRAEPDEQPDESGADESQEQPDTLADEPDYIPVHVSLGPADERLAVRLNRLFAACRSMRGSNPAGYSNARRQLDAFSDELAAYPTRRQMIETRVRQLSGGTFHWEP